MITTYQVVEINTADFLDFVTASPKYWRIYDIPFVIVDGGDCHYYQALIYQE